MVTLRSIGRRGDGTRRSGLSGVVSIGSRRDRDCRRSWPPAGRAAAKRRRWPVFTKDVAPILQDKCQACHRPGYIAPMSLVTFEETRPWARSIKARVAARQMPPWHIDPTVGIQHFKNDRSLTDGADRHDRAMG